MPPNQGPSLGFAPFPTLPYTLRPLRPDEVLRAEAQAGKLAALVEARAKLLAAIDTERQISTGDKEAGDDLEGWPACPNASEGAAKVFLRARMRTEWPLWRVRGLAVELNGAGAAVGASRRERVFPPFCSQIGGPEL